LLLSTQKTESFSVQNTIEKKSHKTPALLLSVAATITYPLSLMYFKSPNGLSAFCFCLKIFPEMFRVVLTSVSYFILIKSVCQPSFIFDDYELFCKKTIRYGLYFEYIVSRVYVFA